MIGISKVFVLGTILSLAAAGTAQAACGIGSNIWEGDDRTSAKILASLTNFWTAKGISTTFGLAGCTDEDNLLKRASSQKVRHFASGTLYHLAVEMARGEGENLDAFAQLLLVREEDRAHFRSFVQANFSALVSHDHISADELLDNLDRLMSQDAELSGYVTG